MGRRSYVLASLITLCFLLAAVTGCGKVKIPDGEGGTIELSAKGGELTVNSKDGEASINEDGLHVKDADGEFTVSTDEEGKVTFKQTDEEGKETSFEMSSEGKIPEGFPKDIPIPKKAKVTASTTSSSSDGTEGYSLFLETKEPIEEIVKLYSDYMEKGGYTDVSNFSADDIAMISGKKGEIQFSAMVTQDENKVVTLILGYEKIQ